ncbi:MAG: hypothetical protein J3R72DRAFT_459712 [Linnemannia gamsii]|nr:MAG: hypothetical protein J3R72DRAFT_459712 [Linnemannia gamsii]
MKPTAMMIASVLVLIQGLLSTVRYWPTGARACGFCQSERVLDRRAVYSVWAPGTPLVSVCIVLKSVTREEGDDNSPRP